MTIREYWKQVPTPVRSFLLKAVLLFVVWKVLYLLVLQPGRVLDKPLSYMVSVGTARTLNVMTGSRDFWTAPGVNPKKDGNAVISEPVMQIFLRDERTLSIGDVCNGLEVMVLYAGLILCLPGSIRRKTIYILSGIVCIQVLNVLRCAGLIEIYLHHPEYLDFAHHYLFTFVVYACIFWLWYLFSRQLQFTKKLKANAASTPSAHPAVQT